MPRHFPQPLHARVLHSHVRVQPLGHGVGDDGLALFLQQGDELLLLGHQRVNLGGFVVEEGGDGSLFFGGWQRKPKIIELIGGESPSPKLRTSLSESKKDFIQIPILKKV